MNTNTHDLHYDSDLIGGPLMVRESRIVAELLLAGVDDIALKAVIMDESAVKDSFCFGQAHGSGDPQGDSGLR